MNTSFIIAPNPKHAAALTSFKNHMLLANKSKSTIKVYLSSVSKIMREFNRLPEECSKNEIIDFLLRHKTVKGIQYASIKIIVYAIRYYLVNVAENLELSIKIPCPKTKYYDIQVLSTHEIHQLINACTNSKQKLIIQMLYETGMRISELGKLSLENIDLNLKYITVLNSKNNVTRTIKFGSTLENAIHNYVRDFPTLFSDTSFGKKLHPLIRLSPSRIGWNLKYIAKKTTIRKKISPHILRHTFSVHYLNFGGSIFQLQNILGHSHMMTTLNYLQYAILPEGKDVSILDSLTNQKNYMIKTHNNI